MGCLRPDVTGFLACRAGLKKKNSIIDKEAAGRAASITKSDAVGASASQSESSAAGVDMSFHLCPILLLLLLLSVVASDAQGDAKKVHGKTR